jgi:hypothetical protein
MSYNKKKTALKSCRQMALIVIQVKGYFRPLPQLFACRNTVVEPGYAAFLSVAGQPQD